MMNVIEPLDENVVIICWFYVKNCIFVYRTDKMFTVTAPLQRPLASALAPKVEALEPPR